MLLDEVLAVGDGAFQRRCMAKINELAASGKTLLFVSHSLTAVASMFSRVIWLDQGAVRMDGDCDEVIEAYEEWSGEGDKAEPIAAGGKPAEAAAASAPAGNSV